MKRVAVFGNSELEVLNSVSFALPQKGWQICRVILKDLEQAKSLFRVDAEVLVIYAHPDKPKTFLALQETLRGRNVKIVPIY